MSLLEFVLAVLLLSAIGTALAVLIESLWPDTPDAPPTEFSDSEWERHVATAMAALTPDARPIPHPRTREEQA